MTKIKIKLKALLKERDMTQGDLAALAKIRPNAVSNLCRGYVDRLSIEHIEKICTALEITDIRDLIDLEHDEN